MGFCKADSGRICWIYLGNRLVPLPNVDCTSLLNGANFYFLPGDKELVRSAPPPHSKDSPSSQLSSSHHYPNLHATLRSIQEEQAFLRAYIETEDATLWGFVQEHYDELHGMIPSQNLYFQDFRPCLETWRD